MFCDSKKLEILFIFNILIYQLLLTITTKNEATKDGTSLSQTIDNKITIFLYVWYTFFARIIKK